MKIRIVLADTDEKYIDHFIRAFKIYYFNEVDIVTFSDSTALKKYISSRAYDILLSVASLLPKEAEEKSMILTSEMGIKEMNGRPAICKYQKVENLYKGILDTIAEQKSGITYSYETSKESPVIAFTSAAGGVGKTTAALVYTRQLVKKGFQVMYLSLESFSNRLFSERRRKFKFLECFICCEMWKRKSANENRKFVKANLWWRLFFF